MGKHREELGAKWVSEAHVRCPMAEYQAALKLAIPQEPSTIGLFLSLEYA